jgi:hypothetical protein
MAKGEITDTNNIGITGVGHQPIVLNTITGPLDGNFI